jgi:hypothetical protein
MAVVQWDTKSLISRSYTCGYCGNKLASNEGYSSHVVGHGDISRGGLGHGHIYICHYCNRPTYFAKYGTQYPAPGFGEPVEHIPSKEVEALYEEARNCMKVNAYTAAVMCCRKLLMNIAVAREAEKGKGFAYYVNYLSDQGFVPPDGKEWVDQIRKKGNEANHEIAVMEREDAEELITFSEMLLRFIYEFSGRMKARVEGQARQPRRMTDTSK